MYYFNTQILRYPLNVAQLDREKSSLIALEAAKKKILQSKPLFILEIIICEGQGKGTREYELINYAVPCWTIPSMDTEAAFVGKVHLLTA